MNAEASMAGWICILDPLGQSALPRRHSGFCGAFFTSSRANSRQRFIASSRIFAHSFCCSGVSSAFSFSCARLDHLEKLVESVVHDAVKAVHRVLENRLDPLLLPGRQLQPAIQLRHARVQPHLRLRLMLHDLDHAGDREKAARAHAGDKNRQQAEDHFPVPQQSHSPRRSIR